MTARTIPFLDLAGVTAGLREELDTAWKSVLEHGSYVGGPDCAAFEEDFAAYCGAAHCVGVANGTDALELILAALGIGPGDEVIVPANTFVATVEAVAAVGARPRFVDVDPGTLLTDPDAVECAVSSATAAVIGVHLYGQMVDVERLTAIADRHGLALVEDAAQAHGASFAGQRAGSAGVAASFSFYPGKNLGALGDGGAVVTSDRALAERIRSTANHGRSAIDRHRHDHRGRNSRLDTLQAAVLAAKLPRLEADNARRAAVMAGYRALLPAGVTPVAIDPRAKPAHHLAVVQVDDRNRITEALTEGGIGWGVHYPIPCHRQPAFLDLGVRLPVVERAASRIVSLPLSPTLRDDEVVRICDVLRGADL